MQVDDVAIAHEDAAGTDVFDPRIGAVCSVNVDEAFKTIDPGTSVNSPLEPGKAENTGGYQALLVAAEVGALAERVALRTATDKDGAWRFPAAVFFNHAVKTRRSASASLHIARRIATGRHTVFGNQSTAVMVFEFFLA